ncbi:HAD family hydrolase [Planktotalea sp.]|uniref:HAD family hydrolase n=1 Tax=Planktotalea sp. TaxID=2029877 RepID=UPI003297B76B
MNGCSEMFKGVLFDKDGTLFDFRGTWDRWAAGFLPQLSGGDEATLASLASVLGYDLKAKAFLPSSIVIAGSNREITVAIAGVLGRTDIDALEQEVAQSAANAPLEPTVALAPYLQGLKDAGYKLGVMTNDAESVAHAHLGHAGVRDYFDFICGSDSGFGAKPDPEPLLAFCSHVKVDPFHTVMVGDSTHDLEAARAAGMAAVGVLTGIAKAAELAPFADTILNNIGELESWITFKGQRK